MSKESSVSLSLRIVDVVSVAAGLAFALPNKFIVQLRIQRVCRALKRNKTPPPRDWSSPSFLSHSRAVAIYLPSVNPVLNTSSVDTARCGPSGTLGREPGTHVRYTPPPSLSLAQGYTSICHCHDEDCHGLPSGIIVSLCCPIARFPS